MSERRLEEPQAEVVQAWHKGKTNHWDFIRGISYANVDEMILLFDMRRCASLNS